VKRYFYMIKIPIERTFAIIKRFCFCVLPFLCSILHWTNVPKWKWILAHKTDDVKALEWNSHQESTIWCIGLPLAEESINIRASHCVELKARLYRVILFLCVILLHRSYLKCSYRKKCLHVMPSFGIFNLPIIFIIISLFINITLYRSLALNQ